MSVMEALHALAAGGKLEDLEPFICRPMLLNFDGATADEETLAAFTKDEDKMKALGEALLARREPTDDDKSDMIVDEACYPVFAYACANEDLDFWLIAPKAIEAYQNSLSDVGALSIEPTIVALVAARDEINGCWPAEEEVWKDLGYYGEEDSEEPATEGEEDAAETAEE